VLGVSAAARDEVLARAGAAGVPAARIGAATGRELVLGESCTASLDAAAHAWRTYPV
jgi:hypothetical protein